MGKSTIKVYKWAIFNSYVTNYQRDPEGTLLHPKVFKYFKSPIRRNFARRIAFDGSFVSRHHACEKNRDPPFVHPIGRAIIFNDFLMEIQWIGLRENIEESPIFNGKIYGFNDFLTHRIHGAGTYANINGVYWWDPCYHI